MGGGNLTQGRGRREESVEEAGGENELGCSRNGGNQSAWGRVSQKGKETGVWEVRGARMTLSSEGSGTDSAQGQPAHGDKCGKGKVELRSNLTFPVRKSDGTHHGAGEDIGPSDNRPREGTST